MVDYEGELAMVIGGAASTSRGRALEVVAGSPSSTTSAHETGSGAPDLHRREVLRLARAVRSVAGHHRRAGRPRPSGPAHWVNDELRQDSSTADLIFGCAALIEYLTTAFRWRPAPSSPPGRRPGRGGFRPPRFLADGDVVRIEIEGIGSLVNPVVQGEMPVPVGLD